MHINGVTVDLKIPQGSKRYFAFEASTGKTYLCNLLQAYYSLPDAEGTFLHLTYSEGITEEQIVQKIQNSSATLIFVDRFDLYRTEAIMLALAETEATVLIDIKDYYYLNLFSGWRAADIKMEKDKIEVFPL